MELYLIIAPSSAGKDKILNGVLNINKSVKTIVSTTSRKPRVGEIDGVNYNFVSRKQAREMLSQGEFLEHRRYNTETGEDVYGITKDSIEIESDYKYLTIVDYDGSLQLKENLAGDNVKITTFYIDCDLQTRMIRSLNREGEVTDKQVLEMCRRAIDDDKNVKIGMNDCDYIFRNKTQKDYIECVLKISEIIGETN
jgi:guanylate kinase